MHSGEDTATYRRTQPNYLIVTLSFPPPPPRFSFIFSQLPSVVLRWSPRRLTSAGRLVLTGSPSKAPLSPPEAFPPQFKVKQKNQVQMDSNENDFILRLCLSLFFHGVKCPFMYKTLRGVMLCGWRICFLLIILVLS